MEDSSPRPDRQLAPSEAIDWNMHAQGLEGCEGYSFAVLNADGSREVHYDNIQDVLTRPLDLLQMRLHPNGRIWGGPEMWSERDTTVPAMKPGPLLDEAALLLARRTGPQWREAADTTLLSWPVKNGTVRGGWDWLQAQIHRSHRQLVPLWRRKTGHQRVLLLDTPLGADGFTLHDLVTASPSVEDLALGAAPDDPRLAMILDALDPQERRVALAWAHWQPNTWAEAAALADAPGPAAYGERVRRKLKRLGAEHIRRRTGTGSSCRDEGRA